MKNILKSFFSEERHNVLVFDANKEQFDFLKKSFPSNPNFIVVSDVNEALKVTDENHLFIVIAGFSGSRTGGFELCEEMKRNINTCHIPFVFISAKNCIEQMIRGYELGADDYVTRPFDEKLLMVRINRLIQNRKRIREKFWTQNFMIEREEYIISKDERFVRTVKKILKENLADPDFNVQKLAWKMNSSTTQLYRNMKKITGHSPVEFMRTFRLQYAYNLLNNSDLSVSEVCFQSGFNHASYFIKCFKKMFGSTPANLVNSFANNGDYVMRPFI